MTTSEAARRLGVKHATIYAYVSRGLLTSQRDPADRTSRFLASEVERLALRGRPRESSQHRSLDISIETRITEIDGHRIRFRGHDAFELARTASFEQVAELLWTGELPAVPPQWRSWHVDIESFMHEGNDTIRDRMRLLAAHAALGSRDRRDLRSVCESGREIIATLVDSLPVRGDGRCPRLLLADGRTVRSSIAGRLWTRLSPRHPTPELLSVLNAALVLTADHEIAASTLAARVAASTRAGPHGVVAAGMGTTTGPMHGGESRRCRRVLANAAVASAREAVDMSLHLYGRVPGFGQVLYPKGDPRATVLLQMLREAGPHPALHAVDELIAAAVRRRLPPPNLDLALAALGLVGDMADDAGEAIFVSARVAGWLAHAMEEYEERPLRFRPRASFVGAARVPTPE